MSTVLRFQIASRTSSAQRPLPREQACEIVIFPGVRIERRDAMATLDPGHSLHHMSEAAQETDSAMTHK